MKKILILALLGLAACSKAYYPTHACRWPHCPYLGLQRAQFTEALKERSGCPEDTDCYAIDYLHLEYPTLDYDQLDSLLFDTPACR